MCRRSPPTTDVILRILFAPRLRGHQFSGVDAIRVSEPNAVHWYCLKSLLNAADGVTRGQHLALEAPLFNAYVNRTGEQAWKHRRITVIKSTATLRSD